MEQNKASTPRQNEDGEQYIETNRRSARRERLDEKINEAIRHAVQEEVGRALLGYLAAQQIGAAIMNL